MDLGILTWGVDQFWRWQQGRRKVRVLVHQAVFLKTDASSGAKTVVTTADGLPAVFWFVKVTNLSASRDVGITHVWVEATHDHPQRQGPAVATQRDHSPGRVRRRSRVALGPPDWRLRLTGRGATMPGDERPLRAGPVRPGREPEPMLCCPAPPCPVGWGRC
jgi:hypothetical protein